MTVSTTTARIAYTGNGVTVAFTIPFKFLTNADVATYVDGVLQSTGVTITGAGGDTGTATFAAAPANLTTVVIVRAQINDQQTDLPANGPFPAQSVEIMADKAMIGIQQINDAVQLSIRAPTGDTSTLNAMPSASSRASMFLVFDANGQPTASSGTGADAGLRADLAAKSLTGNGAGLMGFNGALNYAAGTIGAILNDTCLNVKAFPWLAKGDGVTDDTAAIQACATAAGYGGTVDFGNGTFFVSSTITLRGATKLRGRGVEKTTILRTGNYGDTFVCGTSASTSEPARSFGASGIYFRHSTPFVSGGSTLANKATTGAHLRLYGAQEALIENCWFGRLPYQIYCHGGSWVKVIGCNFQGVYDQANAACQEGVAQLVAAYNAVHGNPTSWQVKGNTFQGATIVRNITYVASSGNVVVNRTDTIGPLYGFLVDGLEDLDCSGNYFGGQSVAEIGFINSASGGVIDIRILNNFFDGISQGQGILFAPTIASTFSLAVTIADNIFTDNYHAIFANQNVGSSTPSVYGLTVGRNKCLSGIASQILINGAAGFVVSNNPVSDYNKHAISTTDASYTTGILVYGVSFSGQVTDNVVGGGGNLLANTVGTNFCYQGVSVAVGLTNVVSKNNHYAGIRTGANFRTGSTETELQYIHTIVGAYQMLTQDDVFLCNKAVGATTAVALPLYPMQGRECVVKDIKGDAAANNITVTTNDGTTIDAAATYVISTNRGFARFRFNGTNWDRVG